jgi:predicted O-methyltransferase YrrM
MYNFSENWFTDDGLHSVKLDRKSETHILEIGSFEGKSTIWFLENLLINDKSTITCVDPWMNYNQDKNSLNSYNTDNTEWKFKDLGIKETFLNNIVKSRFSNKVRIIQELSDIALPQLITQNKKYHLIFIDGNHVAPYVLMDTILSWNLLEKNGYLVFDDYLWGLDKEKNLRPKESIDYFIEIFHDYIEIIYDGYRKVIKRVK